VLIEHRRVLQHPRVSAPLQHGAKEPGVYIYAHVLRQPLHLK
jgi:hypothetical protein